jgi:hypothetical protein
MLILDRQKALEHVARLAARPWAEAPPRPHGRSYQRVAVFERRLAPRADEAAAPAAPTRPVVRRPLHPALDTPLG